MTPAIQAILVQALVGAGILFVIGYIGNLLSFSNRFVNALVTAVVFAAIYWGLWYVVDKSALPADLAAMSPQQWLQMVGMAAVLVFVIDLVANMISFSSRLGNALTTAVVFAILFAALAYFAGMPAAVPGTAA